MSPRLTRIFAKSHPVAVVEHPDGNHPIHTAIRNASERVMGEEEVYDLSRIQYSSSLLEK